MGNYYINQLKQYSLESFPLSFPLPSSKSCVDLFIYFWIANLLSFSYFRIYELSRGYFGCHGNCDWRHGLCSCSPLLLPLSSARQIVPKRHRFLSPGPFRPFQEKRVSLSNPVAKNRWIELFFFFFYLIFIILQIFIVG